MTAPRSDAMIESSSTHVPAAIRSVCERFVLGVPVRVAPLAEGLMNRNWRVDATGGTYVVKEILDASADQVAFQHRVVAALAKAGLPVAVPLVTREGATLTRWGGGLFSVTAWVKGRHVPGRQWSLRRCRHVGALLGRIHQSLGAALPAGLGPVRPKVPEAAAAKAAIDRYLGLIAERRVLDDFDALVRTRLVERREALEDMAHLRPDDGVELSGGYVHGDFQDLNLLFAPGPDATLAAVLDWDRIRVRAYGYELTRSATLIFGGASTQADAGVDGVLDVRRVAAFASGYRSVVRLSDDEVVAAVRQLWWERVCDLWQLQWRYERGDTSCDHLFASSSALLAWWSTHVDQVDQAFTRG